MIFNKYLIICDSSLDIRNIDSMADIMRRVDIPKAVVRSEGVLDVLDHATATNGFGGKLAMNCTSENTREEIRKPSFEPNGDICDKWVDRWGVLILYIEPNLDLKLEELVEKLKIKNINFVAIFDKSAKQHMSGSDLLWLATANSDPRRDVVVECGTMIIDARTKMPGKKGYPARFPNVVTSDEETIQKVDKRWDEYGIGKFVESPSNKYRSIILTNKEDV